MSLGDTYHSVLHLLEKIDSVANAISVNGQDVPFDLTVLAKGSAEILDLHVFACRDKSMAQRVKIGRHLIASIVLFYVSCMHETHKLYPYKPFIEACANAYSAYIPKGDTSASQEEIDKSTNASKLAFELLVSTILPIAIKYLGDNPIQTILSMMSKFVPSDSSSSETIE